MNILVTGASRGVGLAICRILLEQGNSVYAVSRSYTEEFKNLESLYKGKLFFKSVDLSKLEELHKKVFKESAPKPKFVVVNFPHNPTCVTTDVSFYEELVAYAKEERFYIISDIAYADLSFDGYETPSIFQVEGAKDVAVECYTLSKSYNMAGWRVGFVVGNKKLVGALQKIKSWFDYGMFTPIQVASTVALDGPQECVDEIRSTYQKRRDVLVESFNNAGWPMEKPQSTMFVWAKIPKVAAHLGSMEFAKQLLQEAKIAVSPGIGFGESGDGYVRIALIENENRIRQAARNVKKYLKSLEG